MFSEHSPDNTPPPIAHDRLVIDVTRKAVARIEKAKQNGRNSGDTSPRPETAVFAIPKGGRRHVHTLPPGVHVPRKELVDGITVYGCAAHEAMAGTAPLRGQEASKSKRPLVLAPPQALKLAVPIAPVSRKPHDNNAGHDAAAAFEVAADVQSAQAHLINGDDRNRAQRPAGAASQAAGEKNRAAPTSDTSAEPVSAQPSNAPDTNSSEPADREANSTDKTEVATAMNPQKIDAEPRSDAPEGSTAEVFQFPKRPGSTKPVVAGKPHPSKLEAALDLAKRGFAIFPLVPNTKFPIAGSHGCKDATRDVQQIRYWWTTTPDANIGISTDECVVVDVDPRNGGTETFAALVKDHIFPPTLSSKTQGGGRHWFFKLQSGERVRGGTSLLGAGVDVKSWGGYVVGPGSTIDGRPYECVKGLPVALRPDWLIEKSKSRPQRATNAGKRLVEEDEEAVARAQEWLDRRAPTAEEGSRDLTAYKVAATFHDFGVSEATAIELLLQWSDTKSFPPMEMEDIERVAKSAGRNRQNAIGVRHSLASGFEAMDIPERPKSADQNNATSSESAPTPTAEKRTYVPPLTAFVPRNHSSHPPRRWLYNKHYICQFLSITAAPGGLGKSSLDLVDAAAMATGKALLGVRPNRDKQFRVLYWNGEDPLEEIERRVLAILKHYKLTANDLGGRLFLLSGRDTPHLCIARPGPNGLVIVKEAIAEMEQRIRENQIDVAIFDPLISLHEIPENENTANKAVCKQLALMADRTNSSIELVDHMRKGVSGTDGERTANDIRGGGAKVDAARCVRVLNRMTKQDAAKAGVEKHWAYFSVDEGAKPNLALPAERANWYHLVSVNLDNGDEENDADEVGVVTAWEWPDPSSSLVSDDIRAIQKAIAAGKWRENIQANDWAGYAVAKALGWKVDKGDKVGKNKAKMVLEAAIKNGFLRVELGKDDHRNSTFFVVVGKASGTI